MSITCHSSGQGRTERMVRGMLLVTATTLSGRGMLNSIDVLVCEMVYSETTTWDYIHHGTRYMAVQNAAYGTAFIHVLTGIVMNLIYRNIVKQL